MWLKKVKYSYISIFITSGEVQVFCFEKKHNVFNLIHFERQDASSVGIVSGRVYNSFFFMDWFCSLCKRNNFKSPFVSFEDLLLPIAIHYELLFSYLQVPFFSSALKNSLKVSFEAFENKTKFILKKKDIKTAVNLWGVLNE
jgi:hypothetical protein